MHYHILKMDMQSDTNLIEGNLAYVFDPVIIPLYVYVK